MATSYGTIILALTGFGAGVTSAVYWYRSALVDLKRRPAAPHDPNDPRQREPLLLAQKQLWADVRQAERAEDNWNALVDASRAMGRLNRIAALWTAFAVLLSTASSLWSVLGGR
jgi:Mg-chelatase subunit ChlD